MLLASVLGAALIGWRRGRAVRLFLSVWFAVFAFQTIFLIAVEDNPRHRNTGEWDLGYFPFALCVLVLGVGILAASASLGHRRRGNTVESGRERPA